MESASKALLIAGAILVTLAVVAVAVAVASRGEGTLNEIGDIAINDTLVANQVNKFIKYEGQVTGSQVKQCISAALAHNSNLGVDEAIYAVSVIAGGKSYINRSNYKENGGGNYTVNPATGVSLMDSVSTNIINSDLYTCNIEYDTVNNTGTIQTINFTKMP